jgi:hypothetical protein
MPFYTFIGFHIDFDKKNNGVVVGVFGFPTMV